MSKPSGCQRIPAGEIPTAFATTVPGDLPPMTLHYRCRACACAALSLGALAMPVLAVDPPLSSVLVASGFTNPLDLQHSPGDYSRLFVVEQGGKIKIIQNGAVRTTPFLDITSLTDSAYLEYGLLGMCFHPNYQQNGYFYIAYTVGNSTLSDPVIARYHVSADPNVADAASRFQVLRIPYTIKQHRSGWIAFGPDGYLYIATGDGGEGDPQNTASNLAELKGKILRIDVNGPDGIPGTADDDGFPADANKNYVIPTSNPFYNTPGAAREIWCYGLRNAWRCSFDRFTGDLWIGDVGQSAREEISLASAGRGGYNFGWRCIEGTVPTNYSGCPSPLPASDRPVAEYDHSVGTAIIGGYVYRGCAIPGLEGTYFYGDWNGKVFSFRYAGAPVTTPTNRQPEVGSGGVSFGEDAYGEIYMVIRSGSVRKIVPASFIGPDCNHNTRNDKCDILGGTSADANHNGVPDECDITCPTIAQPPAGGAYFAGQSVSMTVGANGTQPFTYQWRRNGQVLSDGPSAAGAVSGADTGTLTIMSATIAAAGNYDVIVSNGCGGATSTLVGVNVAILGDANCDGSVNGFDIDGFVAAIVGNFTDYQLSVTRPGCWELQELWGDVDHSGAFDNFDIDPYVSCLISTPNPGQPCP